MKLQIKAVLKLSIFILIALAAIFGFASVSYACNYHAYRDCTGSAIYWYDSCDNRQDLIQDCASFGQVCQYGQCVVRNIQPYNNYVAYYRIGCQGNSLRWYDSLGVASGLYKNCQDANNCTIDSCAGNKCSNILKCDGSTCAVNSADYNSHCLPVQAGAANNNPVNNNPVNNTMQSDSVTMNPNPAQVQSVAAVSSVEATSGFWPFLKRWYLWILVLLVLIFLFIVVFRRLSSNV